MASSDAKFIIEVPIEIEEYEATIEVDLSQPEFEAQVMAAAGRFRALRRKHKGGPPGKPVGCPECGQVLPTTKELPEHRKICPKLVVVVEAEEGSLV